MNLSLFRTIALAEQRRIELRVESFNLFNWVNYGFPGSNASALGSFGKITSTQGDSRELQMALKFYF